MLRAIHDQRGFSLAELLMATMIFLMIMGATLEMLAGLKTRSERGDTGMDLEQQGRQAAELALDELSHAGLHVAMSAGPEGASSQQHPIVEASPFRIAFYADLGPLHSPMDTAPQTWVYNGSPVAFPNVYALTFPDGDSTSDGPSYFAKVAALEAADQPIPPYLQRNAELIVYTMDADGDGRLDPADKALFGADATFNPSDAVLRRLVFGTSIDEGTPANVANATTVARGVRVYTTEADRYPDGRWPPPLFTYRLSEMIHGLDLDGDGTTTGEFLFGDCLDLTSPACGDGVLEEAEIAALEDLSDTGHPDLADSFRVDKRLDAHDSLADVLTRLQTRFPTLSAADARQRLRDSIASVELNLVVTEADPRPTDIDPPHSVPGRPYRFIEHEIHALVALPDAAFVAKRQSLAADYLRDLTTSDGTLSHTLHVYTSSLCTWPVDATPCWPEGSGPSRGASEGNAGTAASNVLPPTRNLADAHEASERFGPGF
jgi:prepilin-type N-terminal cleavage/methylation domain-containing protein